MQDFKARHFLKVLTENHSENIIASLVGSNVLWLLVGFLGVQFYVLGYRGTHTKSRLFSKIHEFRAGASIAS